MSLNIDVVAMVKKIWNSISLNLNIEIDYEKCKGHGKCVDECPSEVFDVVDGKAIAPGVDDCIDCCACVEACPENAVKHSSCTD
jgi:NAD-dependent dihydropyrimidine dehydrogenase PreA subunit